MEWTFIIPVGSVGLTREVGYEYKVDRVTFVHKEKLPPEVAKGHPKFFEQAETFAVVRETGTPDEIEHQCLELVREECSILSLSQLGYVPKSRRMRPIVPGGGVGIPSLPFLAVNHGDKRRSLQKHSALLPVPELYLDGRWKSWQDTVFFTNLLAILQGEREVDACWREDLRRASLMVGECVGTEDLLKSFIWNWGALETVLTRRGEWRTGKKLPKRVRALLYWVFYSESAGDDKKASQEVYDWWTKKYDDRINDVYDKRNRLLHNGERECVAALDLEFTDHLLVNIFTNLLRFPQVFRSKAEVIKFADEIEKNRSQGVSPRQRPLDFMFVGSFHTGF